MRLSILIYLLLAFCKPIARAQNLVLGSFEVENGCPHKTQPTQRIIYGVRGSSSPHGGTTDFLSICNSELPYNMFGKQKPQHGDSYFGIVAIEKRPLPFFYYREYIQCDLLSPLLKDELYFIDFNISLAEGSEKCISSINTGFLIEKMNKPLRGGKIRPDYILKNDSNICYEDTLNWININGVYKASGNEKVAVIGCFDNKRNLIIESVEPNKNLGIPYYGRYYIGGIYYFIDNISIIKIPSDYLETRNDSTVLLGDKYISNKPVLNETIELFPFHLESSSIIRRKDIKDSLKQISKYLAINPFLTFELKIDLSPNYNWNEKKIKKLKWEFRHAFEEFGISYNRIWFDFNVLDDSKQICMFSIRFKEILY